jgi:exonuclease SbcC
VELNLGKGVYFITGENRDEQSQGSNGAGKSLLCSAFVWGLFEDILRKGVKADDVIGKFDDYTEVEIEFDVEGKDVTVWRTRNHPEKGNTVELTVDGVDRTHATSKRQTTKEIQKELGISKEVLYYCAYYDSERDPLVALTSSELNRVVSEILGTARYDSWLTEVRSRSRDVTAERDTNLKLLKTRKEQIDEIEQDIEDYEDQLEVFADEKAEKIEQLESDIEAKRDERDEFEELIQKKPAVQKERDALKDEVDALEDKNMTIKRLQRDYETQKKRQASKENKLAKIETAQSSSKTNLENLTTNPSGECDVCGNNLADSDKLEEKVILYQKKVDAFEAEKVDVKVDIGSIKSKANDINDKIAELEDEVEAGRDKLKRFNKLEKKLDKFARAEKFVKSCNKRLDALMSRVEKVEKKSPAAIRAKLQKKQETVLDLTSVYHDLKSDIEQADTDIEACDALEEAIKNTKAARFNSFILNLQENINQCLDDMTGGDYHCQLKEDGNELVLVFTNVSKDGEYYPYSVFSKGEKARISKAAATALNSMMDLGFIIDDEAVDGVDDAGIHSILEFVLEKNKDKMLLFVGHHKAMSDHFRGHTNLHVIKDGGESKVMANENYQGSFRRA